MDLEVHMRLFSILILALSGTLWAPCVHATPSAQIEPANPQNESKNTAPEIQEQGDLTKRLESHVRALAAMKRGWDSPGLEKAARYVSNALTGMGFQVRDQSYEAQGRTYRNVIVNIGPATAPLMVIGAHYDSFASLPGADDNASGVASLLALARLLKARENHLKYRYELAAWTLEEPPFYDTVFMGSYVHAAALKKAGTPPRIAISLEMLGYFSDKANSQSFPIPQMAQLYPTTGNFITLVGRPEDGKEVQRFKAAFQKAKRIPVEALLAPTQVKGIDFSDHRSFWAHGYRALMITDTSFYRNGHYHKETDTAERLDYSRMAAVVKSIDFALKTLPVDAP